MHIVWVLMLEVVEREGWTVLQSVTLDFTSAINGTPYRLAIALPLSPPPEGGYPVLAVLDGNANFGTASEAMRNQSLVNPAIEAALVVAIGYQAKSITEVLHRRYRDLTTAAPPERMAPGDPYIGAANGGMNDFLRVLLEEVRPIIAARYPVNAARWALFGHSLGGLTSVRMMLAQPDAFAATIASSPSLHWNANAVFEELGGFEATLGRARRAPRLLVTVASDEQAVHPMTDNAHAMLARLSLFTGANAPKTSFHLFEGETHDSVVPAALSRAVRFAFECGV
ncbi:Ferri-bacillibactin esterase BesA [Alphaproteobacteria bacterium SO-S41]|nr:Ferri-bacillibactin esterase BesA [Alphaproteobacteria bacterium SO-S41]